jgi:hypothetical protein
MNGIKFNKHGAIIGCTSDCKIRSILKLRFHSFRSVLTRSQKTKLDSASLLLRRGYSLPCGVTTHPSGFPTRRLLPASQPLRVFLSSRSHLGIGWSPTEAHAFRRQGRAALDSGGGEINGTAMFRFGEGRGEAGAGVTCVVTGGDEQRSAGGQD